MPKVKGGTFSRKNLTTEKFSKISGGAFKRKKLDDWKNTSGTGKNDDKTAKDPIKCQLGEL